MITIHLKWPINIKKRKELKRVKRVAPIKKNLLAFLNNAKRHQANHHHKIEQKSKVSTRIEGEVNLADEGKE
jgi:hypothetical protein